MVPHSILHPHKHCAYVYQGALPSSRLRYLNKAVSSKIYKKYNWQCTSDEQAKCTTRVEGCQAGRQECYCMHYVIIHGKRKIVLADFNLMVSIPATKLPNLIPRQIFQLYGNTCMPLLSKCFPPYTQSCAYFSHIATFKVPYR